MALDPHVDPFLTLADSLRSDRAMHDTDRLAHVLREMVEQLRTTHGDPTERTRAAALLVASLPPAVHASASDELRALACSLDADDVQTALGSSSPHVRAGARSIRRLAAPALLGEPRPSTAVARETARPAPARIVGDSDDGDTTPATPQSATGGLREQQVLLVRSLAHPSADVRRDAIAAAGDVRMDDEIVAVLTTIALTDPYLDVRVDAVNSFGRQRDEVRNSVADRLLSAADPDVRRAAIGLLGETDDDVIVAARALTDTDAAAHALGVVRGARPTAAIALLWSALPHADAAQEELILTTMREIDPAAVRILVLSALADPRCDGYVAALAATAAIADDVGDQLIAALAAPARDVRIAALRSLSRRWRPEAISAVAACVRDPLPHVRLRAIEVLVASRDRRSVPHLLAAIADPAPEVRDAALRGLGSAATDEDAEQIVEALESADDLDGTAAQEALLMLGERGVSAVLRRLDEMSATAKVRAAAVFTSDGAGTVIRRALGDRDPAQRGRAAEALVLARGVHALPSVLELLVDPDPDVRRTCIELAAALGDRRALDALAIAQLNEPDVVVAASIDAAKCAIEYPIDVPSGERNDLKGKSD